MRTLSILSGIFALLVTFGLICLALVWGMMLNGNPLEIIIATWMALGLSKYMFNALLVFLAFASFKSLAARENYLLFLVPSLALVLWNLAAFPHKLAYGYFLFWACYSAFIFMNRKERVAEYEKPSGSPPASEGQAPS